MSWTAYWLLKWRAASLPSGDAILPRCRRLADFFIARQLQDGMIPTRFDESGAIQTELSRMLMAETGPVALFLFELYSAERNPRYLDAGLRALHFMEREVIPQRKWYDYETFFSLLSRICGEIPVRGAAPSCDKGQFPWLRRCESRRIVWSPLGFRSEEHTSEL